MNRVRLLFILGFLVSMSAGVVVGVVVGRAPKTLSSPVATSQPHGLEVDLKLDHHQAERVHEIWSSVGAALRQIDSNRGDKRRSMGRERDEAIAELIPADRKSDYDRIQQEYAAKIAEVTKDRDKIIQDAEQRMKELLTDTQWTRYQEIKKERDDHWRGGRPGGGRGGPHGPPTRPVPGEAPERPDKPH